MSEPTNPTARQPASKPASADVTRPAAPANSHDQRPPNALAELQQSIGNLGVLQRLADPTVQRKLEVGAPDDKHEREADAVAAAVMRKPSGDYAPASPAANMISRTPDAAAESIRRAPEDEKKHHEDRHPAAPAAKTPPAKASPGATKGTPPAAPGKGTAPAHAGPADKKTPGRAAAKGHAGPGKAAGQHGTSPVTGKPPAKAPVATKGPAKADPKAKAAHDAKAKGQAKHPEVPKEKTKPHEQAHAHQPDAKPKTGTTAKDHPHGHAKPSPHHAGGPPKHVEAPPNQASPAPPQTQATAGQAPTTSERKPDEPVVAAKAATPAQAPSVTPSVARTIQAAQGAGQPVAPADRSFYESRLGRDLSNIRVHDDGAAHRAAKDVQAKAFTYGNDIFFAAGRHQPGTEAGRELMAHELAHTIQQRPGAKLERRIQRQGDGQGGGGGGGVEDPLKVGKVEVPKFRMDAEGNPYAGTLKRSKNYTGSRTGGPEGKGPRGDDQREKWKSDQGGALTGQVKTLIDAWAKRNYDPQGSGPSSTAAVLKSNASAGGRYMVGGQTEMAEELSIPDWDKGGGTSIGRKDGFQVDHIVELQLTGFPEETTGHSANNFQLLKGSINVSSGPSVDAGINKAVIAYLKTVPEADRADPAKKLRAPASKAGSDPTNDDAEFVKSNHNLLFDGAVGAGGPAVGPADFWTKSEIATGVHVSKQVAGKPAVEVTTMAPLGGKGKVAVLPGASGGYPMMLTTGQSPAGGEAKKFAPFSLVNKSFNIGDDWRSQPQLGTLGLEIPEGHKTFTQATALIELERFDGAQFAGHLKGRAGRGGSAAITAQMRSMGLKHASPIVIEDSGLGAQGFELDGYVTTDLPMVSGARLDLAVRGDDLQLSKTFSTGEIHVPAPLKISNCSLTLKLSTGTGLSASGRIDAEIERLGKGFLEAEADAKDGLALKGGFDFQSELFQTAHVGLAYRDGKFSGDGELKIAGGKVTGVKSGSLKATYAEDHFEASGNAVFDIPGIESADVHMTYDATAGLTLSATPKLKAMPGLKSGELTVTIKEPAGGGAMKLSGHGTAEPDIPNVSAQLTVDYDDGAFLAKVTAPFKVGVIDGTITAGATNQSLGEDGTPAAGGAHGDEVKIFGSGSATVKLSESITGTAGIRLLASGEVEVTGLLTVQKNLWDGKDIVDKELVHVATDVPIFPPVVLHVGAGLKFKVGYGAGVLSGSVGITYNPSHEDQAKIDGKLHLHASAYAGLELVTEVGLGLGVTGASITGNIQLGGELRIEANLDDDSHVTWSPADGLTVTNTLTATLQPQFLIHLNANIEATLGPFNTELWHENLGNLSYGSGLQCGLSWPVVYQSNKPFEPKVEDITVTKPEIEPGEMASKILSEKGKG